MATSREHFALDWIRGELLETLSTARAGLEAFAEAVENGTAPQQAAGEDPLRACVNGLHQVHGTLVMLELKGVTLLADHLERVAERLLAGEVADVSGACQSLMQGILELPGYLDELRSGVPDTDTALLPLVNELRGHLGEAPVEDRHAAAVQLHGAASDAALGRFDAIGGAEKTRKIRTAYQQVLLGLLKGGAPSRALDTLRKVAQGMSKVCEGTPFEFQWQAFGEFVESLASEDAERLDNDAVKLLRRVDSEIREIGQSGRAALQRPVPVALIRQLLDAAAARGRSSPQLTELSNAAAQGNASGASGTSGTSGAMSLSGKQALVSAASALREEIGSIKDRLDLFVRSGRGDAAELNDLLAPLKQIGSTLSLLGFESSRSIVLDQVDALTALVEGNDSSEPAILNVAGALVQVDENLAGLTHSGKGEVEKITDDAHRAVAQQTRDALDQVKQSIVDYVSSQWDVRHLQETPAALDGIAGALGMIPLTRAAELLHRCRHYVQQELMAGHVPSWEELDRLADALSGIDYYLERLASENPGGAEDVLELAQRSLGGLSVTAEAAEAAPADALPDDAPPVSEDPVVDEPVVEEPPAEDVPAEESEPHADAALYGAAEQVDVAALDESADDVEPQLEMETDEDFDLSSELFDGLVEDAADAETTSAGTGNAEPEPAITEPAAAQAQETAPATATPSASAAAAVASLTDDFDSDDEIVEIFSEEVDEVLEAIDEHLAPWQAALEDETRQTEIRRAFHTLKGSGRMVGANVLGEMAWSVENMLNRLLDGTVTLTAEFPAVVQEARHLVPTLRDAFEQKSAPDMGAVARIMEQADMLASGGVLADTADHPEPAAAASATEQAAAADDDRNLFIDEARNHIDTLAGASRGDTFVLGDDAMRALHTLSGSAAMAGLAAVAELAAPANELAQALRAPGTQTELGGEAAEFFQQATQAMAATLDDMQAGREPEEQFQLIAEADRLLMGTGAAARSDALLGLPALTSLMKAPGFLDAWLDGTVDMAQADELREALAEIERTARAEGQSAIAGLAGALHGAHGRFEFETLTASAHEVLGHGHEALLAQFDALAADQTPDPATAAGEALARLTPQPAEPEDVGQAPEDVGATPEDVGDSAESTSALPAEDDHDAPVEAPAEPMQTPAVPEEHEPAAAAEAVGEDVDPEIIEVFFEEADELLEALDQGINDWSEEPDNLLHLENLLRALHTLKGGARLSGLTRLGDQTHEFESYLIDFQSSGNAASAGLFDTLHGWYDDVAAMINRIKAGLAGDAQAPQADAEAAAETAEEHGGSSAEPAATVAPEEPVVPYPSADNVTALPASAEPAARPDTGAGAPREEQRPAAEARPDKVAAQAQQRSAQEMVRVGAGLLESLVNLAGESSIIRARVEQGMSDFASALDEMETTIDRLREQLRRLEIETETQVLYRQERIDGPAYEDFDPLEMDRYSQLQQLSRGLGESASDMLDLKETLLHKSREAETLLLQQARVNTELQEGLMRSRMVPFSRLLPRLRRTVRQVAKELDKQVELHAFNVEGELDRSLLERMVPPLEHMLRNAVDHGIEKPEQRRSNGKTEGGRIDLRLSREGGDVVIEISDDGAGIDVQRVRDKAVERGLMAPDAELREDEISQFVLAPGFSTAAAVTQISGRGVGMDVVHSEVKQLGGSISIFSQLGRGTRFVVRVPFTVSVNRALMVSVGEDLYAIPLNTIEGIVLLASEDLERLYAPDGNTFEYAGVPYRIQYLGNFLGREYHPQPLQGSVPVVLVRSGEHAVAVHVDGVQGSREIVVKSLGPQFAGVGGISGATILGDGSVVVILDLLALIRSQSAAGAALGKRGRGGAARTRCVMVVDDSVTVRKVTSRLLERQGMDVVVAKDGVEAVSMLQERRPDVMLLDIEMPRMDGFEVLRQVRHDERLADLPIVMISSRTGAKHQERAAGLGVSRFLGKPFQESDLLATIDELVN